LSGRGEVARKVQRVRGRTAVFGVLRRRRETLRVADSILDNCWETAWFRSNRSQQRSSIVNQRRPSATRWVALRYRGQDGLVIRRSRANSGTHSYKVHSIYKEPASRRHRRIPIRRQSGGESGRS